MMIHRIVCTLILIVSGSIVSVATLITPVQHSIVRRSHTTIMGYAQPTTAWLSINHHRYSVDSNHYFHMTYPLDIGINGLTIQEHDANNQLVTQYRRRLCRIPSFSDQGAVDNSDMIGVFSGAVFSSFPVQFKPNQGVTRLDVATWLAPRLLPKASVIIADVPQTAPAYPAVAHAITKGHMTLSPTHHFHGYRFMTHRDMLILLMVYTNQLVYAVSSHHQNRRDGLLIETANALGWLTAPVSLDDRVTRWAFVEYSMRIPMIWKRLKEAACPGVFATVY